MSKYITFFQKKFETEPYEAIGTYKRHFIRIYKIQDRYKYNRINSIKCLKIKGY